MKREIHNAPTAGKKLKTIFFTLALLALSLAGTAQITHYIDPSFNGQTQNGTIDQPFNSWSKVKFANGNTYLQKKGTTAYNTGNISITGKNNITLGAYGTGEIPKIIKTSSGGHVVNLTTVSNCTVRDLDISATANVISAVIIDGYGTNISSNNLVDNCVLHETEWGVRILTNAAGNRILNCTIYNIGDDGIYAKFIQDIEIGYCNIYHVNTKFFINQDQNYSAGDNIQLVSLNNLNFHIHNNILDHSTTGNKFCFIAAGETYTGIIENNTMIGNSSQTTSCIYLGNTNKTVIIRNNILKDGNYAVYSYVSNLQFHYNKVLRNNQGISVMSNRTLTALNNVFYNNKGITISGINGTTITSKNNIFHISGTNARVYNYNNVLISDNNNFTNEHDRFLSGHSTLSSWQSATGNDINSFIGDPQFKNSRDDDYCLLPGSPCIDRACCVELANDFFGTAVPQGSGPDIGIHEIVLGGNSNTAPNISNQSFSIKENSPNGSFIGQIIADDPDAGQVITYSITSGNVNNAFSVNSTNGILSVANSAALDFETSPLFNLTILVQDDGPGKLNASAIITVSLIDVNESPVMDDQGFHIENNVGNGSILGNINASDPDNGQTLSFQIVSGNISSAFNLNSSTGSLSVANSSAINFMINPIFNLVVRATDNGNPSLSCNANIVVTVSDLNHPPQIEQQTFSIAENSISGTSIGFVSATDIDPGQTLTFTISAGNTNNAFFLNPSSGELTVSNPSALDYEAVSKFILTVTVQDNGPGNLEAEAAITINLIDINDAPEIESQTFVINENLPSGSFVGQVTANDPDQNQLIAYTIVTGNINNAFAINENTGVLMVENAGAINFELTPQFELTIRATDNGIPQLSATSTVTISLVDINESPVFNDQNFEIAHNSPSGSVVGMLIAMDPDQGQSLFYKIISGNTSNAFSLESSTGMLKVSNSSAINEAINPTFELIVSATDNGDPVLSTHATIQIIVTASNHAPQINAQTFNVDENSPAGTWVGQINASDLDAGQTLTYSIPRGNSMASFRIDENGALRVNNQNGLNYEKQATFKLTVMVEDNGIPSLSSTAVMIVHINDLNEAPEIAEGQVFSINEHQPVGKFVGTVRASDPDFNQSLTYSITGGNTNEAFEINPQTGAINIAGIVCYEYCSNYKLNIKVIDNGTPNLRDEKSIIINILDINEAPVITDQNFEVHAFSPKGTLIGQINASDPDFNQSLSFFIISGNNNEALSINHRTGELVVNNPEAINGATIRLIVEVKDNGQPSLSASANATITILNKNEAPVIEDQTFYVPENSLAGFKVGQIIASDPDVDQSLSFAINSGNIADAFSLTTGGILYVNKSEYMAFESHPLFTMEIEVTDNGSPKLSSKATISIQILSGNTPPVMPPQAYSYQENAPNGRYICQFKATDDPGDTFQFYLLDGNTDDAFKLQAYTGRLFVNNSRALDFETNPMFNLKVRVIDNHGAYSDGIIPITLIDVNEAPVVLDQSFTTSRPGMKDTEVGLVEATDPDQGQTLTYEISLGNTDNIFAIDKLTGRISINNSNAFNNSGKQVYSLRIKVRDNGYGYLSTYANVTISITKSHLNGEPAISSDMEGIAKITAYPNPSTDGIFKVKCTDFINQEGTLTVISLSGSVIMQESINSNSETLINLEATPKGIYILRIVDGHNTYTQKLIRQ